ncbi:NAD(P)-linked oxidoreductase superfamily protein [Tasmannia lanceolata]|uniref:NAD(P)-linked oxidoreductase superfamily protein n=1 Tax=Tasmannia lanceolata TaxID=3420 RepID=UPI0040633204
MASSSTPILSPPSATPKAHKIPSKYSPKLTSSSFPSKSTSTKKSISKLYVSSPTNNPTINTPSKPTQELIFFDGGAHYGDLIINLLLGFTLLWLPLTLAAVSRAFFLRYRFSNLRVTVISGLTGQERSDFSYRVIKDVQVVPRFIGEWGDIVITLKDGTKVDLRSVPKFREISEYCLFMANEMKDLKEKDAGAKGF